MFRFLIFIFLAISLIACEQEQLPEQQLADDETRPIPTVDLEVSSEELEQYAELSSAKHEIELEHQEVMVSVVENEGLDVQMYNQITHAVQTSQNIDELEISPEERENYERASEIIAEIEIEMESSIAELFEEVDMDMDRYHEIRMAIQQDPVLQQRYQDEVQNGGGIQEQQPGRVLPQDP